MNILLKKILENKKIYSKIIIIFCLFFLVGCGEIPMQTYENDRFSFQFSNSWHSANDYSVLEDRGIDINNIILALLKRENKKVYALNIVYEILSQDIEHDEFVSKHIENAEELQGYELISKKDIIWGGFSSLIHDYRGVNSQNQKVEYLQTFANIDNISYSITVSSLDFIPEATKQEFSLMLQTFKFRDLGNES